jgi:hypothetical protein
VIENPLPLRRYHRLLRQDFADPPHLRADAFQLLFDVFVAAINVVDAVDDRLAVGDQRPEYK